MTARDETRPRPWSSARVPAPLTTLVGRTGAVADLLALLQSTRLVTLTGAGGSGKTRLAIEVAREAGVRTQDGVAWIELADLSDGGLLAGHLAARLDIPESPGRSITDSLFDALRDRDLLLVLDNCEHLIDACAELTQRLLGSCPGLRVLTTSREALGIVGERAWLVPLLPVPTDDESHDLSRAGLVPSVQLFVDRSRGAVPNFALTPGNVRAIADICRRLDGIPLAIELAAASVRVLAPEQITARLDGVLSLPGARGLRARHRTLRETIDWSYQLLTCEEQQLFDRLAVFAGSFSLDSVEQICGDDAEPSRDVIDVLSALVDKSLVVCELGDDRARYRLLETMRQYARARLEVRGELEALARKMAEHFVAFVELIEPRLLGASDLELQALLEEELPNIRAVVEWSLAEPSRAVYALRLTSMLNWFFYTQGRFREAVSWLEAALEQTEDAPVLFRARALLARGGLAIWQGDLPNIRPPLEKSAALLRTLGEPPMLAATLSGLTGAVLAEGKLDEADACAEEALRLFDRQPESAAGRVIVLYWRGFIAARRGQMLVARESFEQALAIGRALAHRPGIIAHAQYGLGLVEARQGRMTDAAARLTESLRIHHEVHDRWGMFQSIAAFAQVAARSDPERAGRLLGASEAMRVKIGVQMLPQAREEYEALVARVRSMLGEPRYRQVWEAGRAMDPVEAVAYATLAAGTLDEAPAPSARRGKPRETPDLRVVTLGAFDVFYKGKRIAPRAWGSAKARELFVFLLCHADGCTRERAAAALWPEASMSQVRNNFHVTLHRIRRAFREGDLIQADADRYQFDPDRSIDFDAATFEAGARALLARLRAGHPLPPSGDAILSLYKGEFLEQQQAGDWHHARRDALQRLYLDTLLACADSLASSNRERESVDHYRRLLDYDATNEAAVRGLMHAEAALGDPAAVRTTFETLVRMLRNDLDTDPQPETTALFRKLTSAASR